MGGQKELSRTVSSKILEWRRLHYYIMQSSFKHAYAELSPLEQESIDFFVEAGRLDLVKPIIERQIKLMPEEMSIRELRRKAARLGVVNYSRLTREELILILKEIMND